MKFHIISVMYNADAEIAQHIQSLKRQSYNNFQCHIVDDVSTDYSTEITSREIAGDSRFSLTVNNEKKYKVRNVIETIEKSGADAEDVICIVDGDDYLAGPDVLQKVADAYQYENALLTYGSYADPNGHRSLSTQPYSESVIRKNAFRYARWRASHLKTFKFKLYRNVGFENFTITQHELDRTRIKALFKGRLKSWYKWRSIELVELLDPDGIYIRRMDDKVLFYPMLELAGDRAVYIEDILYIYNGQYRFDQTQNIMVKQIPGGHKNKWYGRLIRQVLVDKPRLERLSKESDRHV